MVAPVPVVPAHREMHRWVGWPLYHRRGRFRVVGGRRWNLTFIPFADSRDGGFCCSGGWRNRNRNETENERQREASNALTTACSRKAHRGLEDTRDFSLEHTHWRTRRGSGSNRNLDA